MNRSLKIFLFYSKLSLKTIIQGKLGIFLFTLGKIFRFVFLLSLIYLVFSKTRLVKGYSLDQMIVFYLTFNIVDTTAQILFREVYRFRPMVVSGSFDLTLLKPHHPFFRVLVGGLDFLDVFLLIPTIILTIYFILKLPGITLLPTAFYLLLIANSLVMATAFHIAVLALAILTTEVDHTIMIYRDLTALGRFPMDIYKEPVRGIFTFIIPVGIMMGFPPKALLGLLSPTFFLFSLILSTMLFLISLKLWNLALKKYQSYGG
ncbi:hypothetical protein A2954_01140 [Candidatus Roizmanbacteria bacterium RIFCSPLOWO2_01_FULL_37_12]|uniref:ABC transporter permease n=1 Tax=Candidatus Roizmanbacteria bacterium RIFCSPLOWO2_01_FULL_37_12 TaxID=1802056 RepID=A0A1F7IGE0_9BACT|nr:MAG: hypothetical protein A3D76_01710 [Candidatus Roizmanbacteria bacterium RIFCSPHIGHO2_02_FULL_37_9b]OGK42430.1 MAG: hypothetical protein A2954_01140 [Candidatus Roizmanbacteria bacterium RIFCSPLOWO2_01_FULL_37_12]